MKWKISGGIALLCVLFFAFSAECAGPRNMFPDYQEAKKIIKQQAEAKWGNDYAMVKYEIDNQTSAYKWLVRVKNHVDILQFAKNEWNVDYKMIKYEYEKQVSAYNWVQSQKKYPKILASAKAKWGLDYQMVKYEYEKQVEAYESMN
jgi:hypothetical protein